MVYLKDVNLNELTDYKINSTDDLRKYSQITSALPGNISSGGGGIVWSNGGIDGYVNVTYDYYGGNKSELKKLERYWTDNKKKILLFNATTYLILMPNSRKITIELKVPYKQSFEVTRNDLEDFYGRKLNEYYEDTMLWQKEVIKENINSPKKLNAFFSIHKIKEAR